MTWKDFSIIVMGKEKQELNEWARTRNLAYIVYLSNTAEKSPKSMKSFWHIPAIDDLEVEEEKVTAKEIKANVKSTKVEQPKVEEVEGEKKPKAKTRRKPRPKKQGE